MIFTFMHLATIQSHL